MKMCVSLLVLFCLAGCHSRTGPVAADDELRLSAQAEWAFAWSSLSESLPSGESRSEIPDLPPQEPASRAPESDDPSSPPGEDSGVFSKPLVTAYAPEWKQSCREFLMWYDETPPEFWDGQEFAFKVIRDETPPESEEYPLFVWDAAQTGGWYGIESLIETVKKYPPKRSGQLSGNSGQFEGRRDRKEKKNHDLVGLTASIPGAEILPLILGDETTINRRSSTEQKIPLGYGAVLTIPGESSLTIRQEGEETVAEFTSGTPQVLLPVLRRLWPVGVERLRLREGMLTVELDGWKDIQVRVLQ